MKWMFRKMEWVCRLRHSQIREVDECVQRQPADRGNGLKKGRGRLDFFRGVGGGEDDPDRVPI